MQCFKKKIRQGIGVIIRYCQGKGLAPMSVIIPVQGYTDFDFQSDIDDRKSISGFVFTLGKGVISWRSCKQDTTANSTTKAEYIAAGEAAKEAMWIRKFIQELKVVPSIESPITIYCDNSGAIANAVEPRAHQRTKHIARKYHLIRDIIQRGDVAIKKDYLCQ